MVQLEMATRALFLILQTMEWTMVQLEMATRALFPVLQTMLDEVGRIG